jgi:hypothetical protein
MQEVALQKRAAQSVAASEANALRTAVSFRFRWRPKGQRCRWLL